MLPPTFRRRHDLGITAKVIMEFDIAARRTQFWPRQDSLIAAQGAATSTSNPYFSPPGKSMEIWRKDGLMGFEFMAGRR
jgi:hypothetical protein